MAGYRSGGGMCAAIAMFRIGRSPETADRPRTGVSGVRVRAVAGSTEVGRRPVRTIRVVQYVALAAVLTLIRGSAGAQLAPSVQAVEDLCKIARQMTRQLASIKRSTQQQGEYFDERTK